MKSYRTIEIKTMSEDFQKTNCAYVQSNSEQKEKE